MMNLALNAGVNQMKDQTQNLIQNEMQDKGLEKKEENDPKEPNLEINENRPKQIQQKKKKKVKLDKNLTRRMYSVLFFHTMVITILLYIFRKRDLDISDELGTSEKYVFIGCIILSVALSFLVSKVKFISKIFLNYLLYIALLGLNIIAFVYGGKSKLFDYVVSMMIMFDAGSITIITISSLVNDNPSTFWLMCCCAAGHLVAMFILMKIYEEHKYFILFTCGLAFAIYEAMIYNSLESFNKSKTKSNIPSMMSLPFELNVSFAKIIYYVLYAIFYWFKSCCCASDPKKK